jgi:riboflavin transporter FmnP
MTPNLNKYINVRKLTVTAILAALAAVLQLLNFSVPLMPGFIKLDFSELPALMAAFALGPVSGVTVCFIKNLIDLIFSGLGETLGIGPLSNFILGAAFVFTAGIIYHYNKTRKGAVIGSLIGALVMAAVSIPSNLLLVYPIYEIAILPESQIIEMYNVIYQPLAGRRLDSIWQCILIFNAPFTFIKAMISVIITMVFYKRLSPIIKGVQKA